MSAPPYRQPGQYEESGDVERRLQEEYRRGQGPPRVGFPGGRPGQGERGGYPMPMAGSEGGMPPGASPYYGRSQHPSPYGRPYMGGQGGGYGGVHSPNDLAAGMYARRAVSAYGYGVPPHGPSSGTSPDQRYPHPPPYGMPPGAEGYAGYGYPRQGPHDMYGQRLPDGSMGHPPHLYGPQSPPNAPSPKGASPSSRATPPGIPGSGGSKGQSGDADDDDDGRDGHHGDDSGAGSGSENEEEDEENEDIGEAQKWFHGSVPLGLEDDKYWLSELQVYLRANFAEAFGATEEDIAGK
jgi:hypothetical protein